MKKKELYDMNEDSISHRLSTHTRSYLLHPSIFTYHGSHSSYIIQLTYIPNIKTLQVS